MARTLPLERSLRFLKGLNSTRGCDRASVTGSEHLVCRWHWQARVLAQ